MAAGSTYTPIATTTLGSAQQTITFSSIAGTYTDLVIAIASGSTATGTEFQMRFNSDTGSNYSRTSLGGNGTSALSSRATNATKIQIESSTGMGTGQTTTLINVMNYANTSTYKTALLRASDAGKYAYAVVGLWRSTSAITSIDIINETSTFTAGSTFTLYGIAAA